jgi:hypothetical protein
MKQLLMLFLIMLTLATCISDNGEKFVGKWHHSKDTEHFLIIEHLSGKDYLVQEKKSGKRSEFDPLGWDGAINERNNFSFQDNKLVGPMNLHSIVYANNKLVYDGEEYEK